MLSVATKSSELERQIRDKVRSCSSHEVYNFQKREKLADLCAEPYYIQKFDGDTQRKRLALGSINDWLSL